MLNLTETYGFVDASAAAADTQEVSRPADGFRHLFLVTISAAANLSIEAAVEPVAPGAARWVPVSGVLTQTESIAVAGNFTRLRVTWNGNTGTVSVDLIQSAQTPDYY